ncbi:28187_t:CDS:2 [Dentiscutata erythropus]|uniref:28187_t:CDS:1 n=1 Tax=Dentiscutata erythropus TaxID=1348616 RepID=A0A9N9F4R5_9GLOM|nr:28187_t:CDS:2 [Dentiscutata erythropus]
MDSCETSDVEWNDPDNTYVCLDSDFSLATDNVSETSLVSNINDDNSYKFLFNYEAFQKTHESIHYIDDDVTTNDIKDDSSFISSERNSNDFNAQEEDYEIDDILLRFICSKCFQSEGGHLFERKGTGVKSYTCHDQHVDENKNALILLGRWLTAIAESNDEELKQDTLNEMTVVLSKAYHPTTKNDKRNITNQLTLMPSLLLIKTIMQLRKVKINRLKDDYQLEKLLISEDQSNKLGEAFRRAIWNVRSNIIQNKTVLKSPESFDQYRNGFPNFLRNFFDSFITFIQKKKYQICLKKQKQRKGKIEEFDSLPIPLEKIFAKAKASPKDYLFKIGTSIFTNQMNLEFENTFHSLSTRDEKELDIDKVFEELIKRIAIKPGCQAFTQQNFTELFKNATEYMAEGFNNLFTCYNLGIERLKNIHSQEITKEIPYTTKGRREKNVRTNMISQQIKTEKHRKEIEKLTRSLQKKERQAEPHNNFTNEKVENVAKRKRRHLTKSEQEIFAKLIELNELSAEEISRVFVEICTLPDTKPEDWDIKRIRSIWGRKKSAKKKKQNLNLSKSVIS